MIVIEDGTDESGRETVMMGTAPPQTHCGHTSVTRVQLSPTQRVVNHSNTAQLTLVSH